MSGYVPQAGFIAGESERLAHADFDDDRREPTGEDHAAHVAGKICAVCGLPIKKSDPARLRGDDDWVHDVCPEGATKA